MVKKYLVEKIWQIQHLPQPTCNLVEARKMHRKESGRIAQLHIYFPKASSAFCCWTSQADVFWDPAWQLWSCFFICVPQLLGITILDHVLPAQFSLKSNITNEWELSLKIHILTGFRPCLGPALLIRQHLHRTSAAIHALLCSVSPWRGSILFSLSVQS